MMQYPVWVWVVAIIGVIAAGVGLGYLIIYLFWKLEKYFAPKLETPANVGIEEILEEPSEPQEAVEEPIVEEESLESMDGEIIEEITPMPIEAEHGEGNRLVKFSTVLRSAFQHPFQTADTIVCWDIALEDGAQVLDSEGNVMKFRVVKSQAEAERTRYFLVDEGGQHTIEVIHGKDYLKRETNLDFDTIPG